VATLTELTGWVADWASDYINISNLVLFLTAAEVLACQTELAGWVDDWVSIMPFSSDDISESTTHTSEVETLHIVTVWLDAGAATND